MIIPFHLEPFFNQRKQKEDLTGLTDAEL